MEFWTAATNAPGQAAAMARQAAAGGFDGISAWATPPRSPPIPMSG
jgi:hypothetical protein